jgi:hypothetical protein
MSSFRLVGLPDADFTALFDLPPEALAQRDIRRVVASERNAFPCRVSLVDAEPGDELLLLPYEHQPAASPYRASGPIFVRRGARQAVSAPDVVPDYVARRLMSWRAYDANHMMVAAEVCEGRDVGAAIARTFDDPTVAYIHLHNARRGCFSCRAERA